MRNLTDYLGTAILALTLLGYGAGAGWAQTPTPAPANPSAVPPAPPPAQVSDTVAYTGDKQVWGETGVPIVKVRLNDSTDASFLVDTGSSDCAVTDVMADNLGLKPHPVAQAAAPLIMDGTQAQAAPLTIQVGRFRFKDFPTVIIKDSRIRQVLGHPLDGILGANLLSHFALLLQPQSHVLTLLSPGGLSPDERRAWGFTRAATLPLTRAGSGTYWVPVSLANGAKISRENLMVDTGSVTSIVSYQAVQALGLSPQSAAISLPFGTGVVDGALTRVPAVGLGTVDTGTSLQELTLKDGSFLYPRTGDLFGSSPHVLGMNILSRCAVLLDFPGTQMSLQVPGI